MASPESSSLTEVPALAPPSGVSSDFDTLYSGLQPLLIAVIALYLILSTIIVGARLVTKGMILRLLQVEDYVVFVAWLGFTGWAGFTLAACYDGLGRHQWNISASGMIQVAKLTVFSEIYYCAVAFIGKLALLLQYMRIFVPARRGIIHVSIHILIWSNLVVYLFVIFWLIFACNPREKIWNPTVPGTCLNPEANSLFTSSWNMVSDLLILALPLYSIWRLQMPVRRKVGVSAVFAVGLFGCVASVARIVFSVRLLHSADQNFVIIQAGLWSFTEVTVIIISSSLPVLPRFFQAFTSKSQKLSYSGPSRDEYLRRRKGTFDKYSDTLTSNGTASTSWGDTKIPDPQNAYIQLGGLSPSHKRSTDISGGYLHHQQSDVSQSAAVDRDTNPGSITKTVRMESRQEPLSDLA